MSSDSMTAPKGDCILRRQQGITLHHDEQAQPSRTLDIAGNSPPFLTR